MSLADVLVVAVVDAMGNTASYRILKANVLQHPDGILTCMLSDVQVSVNSSTGEAQVQVSVVGDDFATTCKMHAPLLCSTGGADHGLSVKHCSQCLVPDMVRVG